MSASLVGSEMCIRDRTQTKRRSRRVVLTGRDCLCQFVFGAMPRAVLGAVSYTHLTLPTICSV
eukprot:4744249-Alexandrium_andersonii.AAC.1